MIPAILAGKVSCIVPDVCHLRTNALRQAEAGFSQDAEAGRGPYRAGAELA
jgi:hypothetical protein